MNLNEAKAAYIEARKSYREIISHYDRKVTGAREARFQAYSEVKQAQIDLIDVFADLLEDSTGELGQLNDFLDIILSDASARDSVCELALRFRLS